MLLLFVNYAIVFRDQFIVLVVDSFFEIVDSWFVKNYVRAVLEASVFFWLSFDWFLLHVLLHEFAWFSCHFRLLRSLCLHRLYSFCLLLRGNLAWSILFGQIFLHNRVWTFPWRALLTIKWLGLKRQLSWLTLLQSRLRLSVGVDLHVFWDG